VDGLIEDKGVALPLSDAVDGNPHRSAEQFGQFAVATGPASEESHWLKGRSDRRRSRYAFGASAERNREHRRDDSGGHGGHLGL
jgi:hypothetical protein